MGGCGVSGEGSRREVGGGGGSRGYRSILYGGASTPPVLSQHEQLPE